MIAGIWLFFKGAFDLLMRISLPLLIVLVIVAACSIPPTWRWATASHKLHIAERKIEDLGDELSTAKADLAQCQQNTDRLTSSLEEQNAAVEALKAEGEARTRRANAAIAQAQAQARGLRVKITRLEHAKPTGDVCASARSLIIETLREDRP